MTIEDMRDLVKRARQVSSAEAPASAQGIVIAALIALQGIELLTASVNSVSERIEDLTDAVERSSRVLP